MTRKSMSVKAAVERDLAALEHAELAEGGIAAAALALAQQMDDSEVSAQAKASCAKSLADVLEQLRELDRATAGDDSPLAKIRARRDERMRRNRR